MVDFPIEILQRIFRSAPFIVDLGIEPEFAGAGECVTTLEIQPKHLQQNGVVHAGVQATMADHSAGVAAATLVKKGQIVLTAEFKINLLSAARGDHLVCRAKVLKPGSMLSVVESEVYCVSAGEEKLVSKALVTIAVVTPS